MLVQYVYIPKIQKLYGEKYSYNYVHNNYVQYTFTCIILFVIRIFVAYCITKVRERVYS